MSGNKKSNKNFTIIENEFIRSNIVPRGARLLYPFLKSFNPIFPSYQKMKTTLHISDATISKSLIWLEKNKLLTKTRRGQGRSNVYKIHNKETWINNLIDESTPINKEDTSKETPLIPINNKKQVIQLKKSNKTNCNKTKIKKLKEEDISSFLLLSRIKEICSVSNNPMDEIKKEMLRYYKEHNEDKTQYNEIIKYIRHRFRKSESSQEFGNDIIQKLDIQYLRVEKYWKNKIEKQKALRKKEEEENRRNEIRINSPLKTNCRVKAIYENAKSKKYTEKEDLIYFIRIISKYYKSYNIVSPSYLIQTVENSNKLYKSYFDEGQDEETNDSLCIIEGQLDANHTLSNGVNDEQSISLPN